MENLTGESMNQEISELRVVRDGVDIPDIHRLHVFRAHGGYAALEKALHLPAAHIIRELTTSGLGGRGGAGFPTGRKWQTARDAPGVPVVVANGDESEPGAFKDRELMETLPHRILEGALIAAHTVGADQVILFVRGEYDRAHQRLTEAVAEASEAGIISALTNTPGDAVSVHLHRSAGAYICGEETALIEALEGNRPMPRGKPPFPAVSGYLGRPTVINNVETLAAVPAILNRGGDWYRALGAPDCPGTRVFSLSGNVRFPGNYELPTGTPLRALIEGPGGGVPGDRAIKAVIPGGTSTPLLTPDMLDAPLSPQGLATVGSALGTGSVIVYDETNCMVDLAANMSLFYRDESCGKCTPCRDGTHLMHEILSRIEAGTGDRDDLAQLERICGYVPGGSVCGLGPAAVAPVASSLRHFRGEYMDHISGGHCPVFKRYEVRGQCFPVIRSP